MSSSVDNGHSTTVENSTIPNIVVRSASQQQDKIQTPKIVTPQNAEIIGFSRPYLFSVSGILRLFLILFQFAAWVSAAAVPKTNQGYQILTSGFSDSRSAFLFFSVTGFLIAGFLFFMNIMNLVSDPFFKRFPWNYFICATDAIWFLSSLALGITSAVRESQISDLKNGNVAIYQKADKSSVDFETQDKYVNQGSFASAACFSFLCMFIYIADGAFHVRKIMANKK